MKYLKYILNTYLSFLKPIIVWMIKTCCTPIIGFYNRRWTQYTKTGKIALCCIAKMENDYIRFFVEYYKNLHFDKIFIYDNNNTDGEKFEDVKNDYIQSILLPHRKNSLIWTPSLDIIEELMRSNYMQNVF